MAFHVGQKVVCVDATGISAARAPLKNNGVYTIRDVIPEDCHGGVHLLLHEVRNTIAPGDEREYSYMVTRFRPLIKKSTDTGFAILEEIRRRETLPADERRVTAPQPAQGGELS